VCNISQSAGRLSSTAEVRAMQPDAARQIIAVLGALSKRAQRRGKLSVVKSLTDQRTTG
jgi:hypothetical protein